MSKFRVLISAVSLSLACLLALSVQGASAAEFNSSQQKAIEKIVHDYLVKNPEVLIEAMNELDAKQAAADQKKQGDAIAKYHKQIFEDPTSYVAGNPKGDVTIVEFFDYHCGYCKKVFPEVQKLLKSDGNIRYVYKELPILSPESVFAARAALAGWKTDPAKYEALRNSLMSTHGALPKERVFRLAKEAGYDTDALRKTVDSPEIQAKIKDNFNLAQTLNIRGTPAFIIGDTLVPGAVDIDTLRQLVAQARKG